MEYAGRLHRFAAFIIDAVIVSVIIVVLNALGVIDLGNPSATDQVLEAVISFGYYKPAASAIFKREFVIRALGAFAAVILGAAIGESGEAIGGLIGFVVFIVIAIMVLFDERRQGLHDKIGGTFVVKGK